MSDPTITITNPSPVETLVARSFQAPAPVLFDLWTRPELVRRWWPSTGDMTDCEIDLRPGGRWRWAHTNPDYDVEVAYSGIYTEVDAPRRLTFTERFEMMPGSDYVNTISFEESGARTTVTSHLRYASTDWRDGHRAAGFDDGLRAAYQRVDRLLEDSGA